MLSGLKRPESAYEPDDEAALNKAYQQLRGGLKDAGRAALKTEEEAWLKQRESLLDEVEQNDFTRQRVAQLRARLGK